MDLEAKTKDDVEKLADKKNIKFVQLWFTDILGQLKHFEISRSELETALDEGAGFDGSSIEGYRDIEESDMMAHPDPTTFQSVPWGGNGEVKVGRLICDIKTPNGKPYDGDPRYILKKQVERAVKKGFIVYMGPELEYFYFKDASGTEFIDAGGYFDLVPLDMGDELRRDTILALETMGIAVEVGHHEVAESQHEIDLRYGEALTMADKAQTYKLVVKEIARQKGVHATFMPKPVFGINGSGMHTHQSLFKGKHNAFFDKKDDAYLSDIARGYIAGLLKHAREMAAVTNQSVNSYKRLVPGYEAPVYVAWSLANRSALVRVPNFKPGKENATRIELRNPDPGGNPYLQFAVMIAAGLEGIERGYKLPASVDKNIYELSEAERKELDIPVLPGSLGEAVELFSQSELMKKTLGTHMFERFVEIKSREWDEYRMYVTKWELDRYLPRY